MSYSFELIKKNFTYVLKVVEHNPPGTLDHQFRFELTSEEVENLRNLIGSKVISYDMKDFEKRLMNLESRYDAEVQGLIDEQNILTHHVMEVDKSIDDITTSLALIKFFTKSHLEKAHEQNPPLQTDKP